MVVVSKETAMKFKDLSQDEMLMTLDTISDIEDYISGIDGTPDFVKEKTCEVLNILKPGGGYIAGASHDTILEETPVENVLAMFDTIREYGVY